MLPKAAGEALTKHLLDVRRMHDDDLARGFGRVVLPFALVRKFPNASAEWRWRFVVSGGTAVPRSTIRTAVALSHA